jgi:hypothetical protein
MDDFLFVNAECTLPQDKEETITVFKSLDEMTGLLDTSSEQAWAQFSLDVRRCSLCINSYPFDHRKELSVLKNWMQEHYASLFSAVFVCCSQTIFADHLISIQRALPRDQYVAEGGFPLHIDLEPVEKGFTCRLQKKLRIVQVDTEIKTEAIIALDIFIHLHKNEKHRIRIKCTRCS